MGTTIEFTEKRATQGRALRVQHVPRFPLECGVVLENARQAYYLDGELNAERDNLVLVFHSLSASPDALGDWWRDLIGPGKALDTRRYAVLCANLLGSCFGSTGPSTSPLEPFPQVTLRDMVRFQKLLLDELGVRRVRLATGGSLGGMLALEWAATFPDMAEATVAYAAPAALSAFSLGWNHLQRRAIQMGGVEGLRVARMAGMMVYRTADEFQERFGRDTDEQGRYRMWSYLDHHGQKLSQRFDPQSYLAILDAIATHDVGRGRGGTGMALGAFEGRLIGVGIPSDVLYRDEEVRQWTHESGAEHRILDSPHGHDSFLLEPEQVGAILLDALGEPTRDRSGDSPDARRAAAS